MAPITTARLATCVVAATLVSAAAATLPTEALADDGPASVPSAPRHGAVTRHRRGARGGGERRGRGRDRRRARRGGAGDGAGGACGRHVHRRTERCDARRDRACGRDGTRPGTSRARYHAGFVRYRGWYRHNGHDGGAGSGDGGAGLADQRQRQRPDREPGRQRARHAGECRGGRHVGRERHRCRRERSARDHAAAPSTTSGAHASTPASQPAAASSSTAQDDPETWTWQWNCLSKPDLSVIPPVGSTTGSVPKNWTWIWNCGENPVSVSGRNSGAVSTVEREYRDSDFQPRKRRPCEPDERGGRRSRRPAGGRDSCRPRGRRSRAGSRRRRRVGRGDTGHDIAPRARRAARAGLARRRHRACGRSCRLVDDAVDLPYVLPPLLGTGTFRLVERQRLLPGLRGLRRPRDRAPRTGRRARARNAFRRRRRGSLGGRALGSLGRLARRAPRRSARRAGARRFPSRCRRRSRPARASLPRPAGARPAAAYPSSSLFRSWLRCSIWPGASRSIACRCLRVIAAACPKTPVSAPSVPIRPGAPAPGRCALRKEQRSHETHHDTPRCAPARPVLRRGTGGGGRRRWRCADRGPVRHERAVGRRRERRLPGRAVQQRVARFACSAPATTGPCRSRTRRLRAPLRQTATRRARARTSRRLAATAPTRPRSPDRRRRTRRTRTRPHRGAARAAKNDDQSIRVLSPGNGGDVTQSNSATAGAAALNGNETDQTTDQTQSGGGYGSDQTQIAGQAASNDQSADAAAAAFQVEPSNSASSIRVLSPGNDGDVSQENAATAIGIAANGNATDQSTEPVPDGRCAADENPARADTGRRPGGLEHPGRQRVCGGGPDCAEQHGVVDPRAQPRQRRQRLAVEQHHRDRGGAERQRDGAERRPEPDRRCGSARVPDGRSGTSKSGKGSDATQIAGQKATNDQSANAEAAAVQVKPSNSASSIRVLSPGNDGDVSQSNSATAVGIAANLNLTGAVHRSGADAARGTGPTRHRSPARRPRATSRPTRGRLPSS